MTTQDPPTEPCVTDPKEDRLYVISTDFMKALHEAGLLPQYPQCSRVVIDATVGQPVRMFVDQIPTGALLRIAPLMTEPERTET